MSVELILPNRRIQPRWLGDVTRMPQERLERRVLLYSYGKTSQRSANEVLRLRAAALDQRELPVAFVPSGMLLLARRMQQPSCYCTKHQLAWLNLQHGFIPSWCGASKTSEVAENPALFPVILGLLTPRTFMNCGYKNEWKNTILFFTLRIFGISARSLCSLTSRNRRQKCPPKPSSSFQELLSKHSK